MNQDGYTLAETLAALVMIGLAMGGLTAGVRVIGLNQAAAARHLADGRGFAGARLALSRLFDGQGPFASSDVAGLRADETHMSFGCADTSPCAASLETVAGETRLILSGRHGRETIGLAEARRARFAYVGSRTVSKTWPPQAQDPQSQEPQTLRSIMVLADMGRGEAPIATVRLWREGPVACAFDPISQSCRTVTP